MYQFVVHHFSLDPLRTYLSALSTTLCGAVWKSVCEVIDMNLLRFLSCFLNNQLAQQWLLVMMI